VSCILVADDNSNIQKMVAAALKGEGIDVLAVANGEAAIRKIAEISPELVLADIFMPVRSGYEVCEFVKNDSRYMHTPVVLLVGAFDPLDDHEAQRVRADGVLKKPFVPAEPLINLVKSLLAKSANERLIPAGVASNQGRVAVEARVAGTQAAEARFVREPEGVADRTAEPDREMEDHPIRASHATLKNPVAEIPNPEDSSLTVTAQRDPSLGEPFWNEVTEAEGPQEESSEDLTDGHSWGKGPRISDFDDDDIVEAPSPRLPLVAIPDAKDATDRGRAKEAQALEPVEEFESAAPAFESEAAGAVPEIITSPSEPPAASQAQASGGYSAQPDSELEVQQSAGAVEAEASSAARSEVSADRSADLEATPQPSGEQLESESEASLSALFPSEEAGAGDQWPARSHASAPAEPVEIEPYGSAASEKPSVWMNEAPEASAGEPEQAAAPEQSPEQAGEQGRPAQPVESSYAGTQALEVVPDGSQFAQPLSAAPSEEPGPAESNFLSGWGSPVAAVPGSPADSRPTVSEQRVSEDHESGADRLTPAGASATAAPAAPGSEAPSPEMIEAIVSRILGELVSSDALRPVVQAAVNRELKRTED